MLNILKIKTAWLLILMVSGFAPIGAQWSVHENIINQMESGKQFNIKGKLTIRATFPVKSTVPPSPSRYPEK